MQRRGTSLADLGLLSLLLADTLGQKLSVLGSSVLLGLGIASLKGSDVPLALETLRSNKTLDLGSLGVGLVSLDNLTTNDILADIVLLGETKELSNVVGSLGSESLGKRSISKTGNISLSLLNNHKGKNGKVSSDNASTDGLSLSLTITAGTVTRVALGKQKADTSGVQDSLLHGETLLVVTSSDLEDVSLPLITKRVALDLLAHALLVEHTNTVLVVDFNQLLGAVSGICNVELHGAVGWATVLLWLIVKAFNFTQHGGIFQGSELGGWQ